jgi:hypothetical protein
MATFDILKSFRIFFVKKPKVAKALSGSRRSCPKVAISPRAGHLPLGSFLPVVRHSLYLACAIDILFLRYEEPYRLFEQGGDIDNRLKCFFDALSMPSREQAQAGVGPDADPLCCLLEDDRLISDFSIRTGRLLGKCEKNAHDVRIQADITIKVLRVMDQNLCLVSD